MHLATLTLLVQSLGGLTGLTQHHGAFGCRRVIIQPDEKTPQSSNYHQIISLSPVNPAFITGLDSGCGTKDASKKPSRNGHHGHNGYKGRAGHDGGG